MREARASLQPSPLLSGQEEEAEQTSAALANVVRTSLETITMVATKSSQLKGTYVRALKDAVKGIQEAVSQIRARTMTEEVVRLEAANSKLTKEVADLRRDLQELRQRPSQPVSSEPSLRQLLEETARANAEMFGNMLNARLAGIEDRLLPEPRRRPPLAADTRSARADPAQSAPAGAPVASTSGSGHPVTGPPVKKATKEAPVNSQASSAPPSSGKKGKSKKKSLAAQEAAEARRQPAPAPTAEPWTAVVGRKAKNKAAKAAKAVKEPQKPRPTAQKRAKLRTPRTAAVSLTLVPGVEERGVTYASILSDAKRRVSLADLGISNMRFRRAATGARLLEIGGENSAAKADSLAKKLREVLSPDAVKVVRPVKRAEIRVTGLDDSADAIEVADAVAKEGGCAVDDVKHGRIVVGPRGDGSLWISCPVAAAKRLSDSGRLLVGWTSARVRLLDSRPARCYRCLEPGHLGVKCSCEVDRSRLCFRCGQPDHQARDCSAEPHCPVCATAGKPAAHSIGGSGCISAAKPAAKSPQESAPKPKRPKRKAKAKRAGAEHMDTVP
ncbi:translation initiation factor IF-2-like [Pectinophora gossypiella]|uniref:translation initiation factor IF-2-like n=1 Tax=Pectinophora gossypiella TaxID=13191 RepID=UPI00214E564A|nr:translation initiation factor IF-2-like [Pectinophora gossypiella]